MKILIVGLGHAGFHLVKHLEGGDNVISVIDHDEEKCKRVQSDEYQVIVYLGDGADPELLRAAGIKDMDLVIACTDDDETNLKLSEYAKREFGVPRLVGLSNSPKFKDEISKYADVVICPVEYILYRFERAVKGSVVYPLYLDRDRNVKVLEARVRVDSAAVGMTLGDIIKGLRVSATLIHRGGANVFPYSDEIVQGGDRIFVIGESEDVDRFTDIISKRTG